MWAHKIYLNFMLHNFLVLRMSIQILLIIAHVIEFMLQVSGNVINYVMGCILCPHAQFLQNWSHFYMQFLWNAHNIFHALNAAIFCFILLGEVQAQYQVDHEVQQGQTIAKTLSVDKQSHNNSAIANGYHEGEVVYTHTFWYMEYNM